MGTFCRLGLRVPPRKSLSDFWSLRLDRPNCYLGSVNLILRQKPLVPRRFQTIFAQPFVRGHRVTYVPAALIGFEVSTVQADANELFWHTRSLAKPVARRKSIKFRSKVARR